MDFRPSLLVGRFVKRYKRFFAEIDLDRGERVVAHCPNPGSMRTCLEEGATAWVSERPAPERKLRFTWELTRIGRAMVYVNPTGANALVAEAIKRGVIREVSGYALLEREVRYRNSRIDFCLTDGHERCYIEVKNVTLKLHSGTAAFPDSVTARGTKHLRDLIALRETGARAVLLFCVSRTDAVRVVPADEIDPEYGQTLRRAVDAGVEVLAYGADISPRAVQLTRRIPVAYPPS